MHEKASELQTAAEREQQCPPQRRMQTFLSTRQETH